MGVSISNTKSDIFFDMICILQNAFEIHLIDSIWAAFIYLLDAKYKLFNDKQIYIYALRGHHAMFTRPIKLLNWKIINMKNRKTDNYMDFLYIIFIKF